MVGTRLTPPDIQDGPLGYQPGSISNFESVMGAEPDVLSSEQAKKLGVDCYEASTNWLNSGRRAKWSNSLRQFQSEHSSGSKYLSNDYRYRSRLFRPKTRAMVRRAEAQTAAAFFSNEDVVSITAQDDDNPQEQASAEIMQQLLQYRLTRTIPWFLTLVGARQDAEVMGVCIGKAFWKYAESYSHSEVRPALHPVTGTTLDPEGNLNTDTFDVYRKDDDKPWVDLVAPENVRFDPGADWRNPVSTSPYWIELIPMYLSDARAKIKSGEWLQVAESALRSATDLDDDTTRRSREQGRVPGKDHDAWKPRDFDICWVRENIIRYAGQDWHYFTMGSAGELLTEPKPLKEVYLHGIRPYACGFIVPETHKTYPSSKVELVKDLQQSANDTANLRMDNVKLALNPRQVVRRGAQIDLNDLKTFMPGKSILAEKPGEDIVWDRPPEVTSSSYEEQDRINLDFDELAGDFSAASMASGQNPVVPETVGGMEHMAAPAASLNEYELRVFAETFVEPIIRQLVKLEQAYETDPVVLALAGQKAQLLQKFGVSEITDELLNRELTIRVNVGIGATNPKLRLQNFLTAGQAISQLFGPAAAMGAKFEEVTKEVFALCGYKDGARFFVPGFNPQQAMQQMQQGKNGGEDKGKLQIEQQRLQLDAHTAEQENQREQMKAQAEIQEQQAEVARIHLEAQAQAANDERDHQFKLADLNMRQGIEIQKLQAEQDRAVRVAEINATATIEAARIKAEADDGRAAYALAEKQLGAQPDDGTGKASSIPHFIGKQIADHVGKAHQALADQVSGPLTALQKQIQDLHDAHSAPREIVKGPDGKAAGVRVGSKFRALVRGPDGKPLGLQ